MELGRVSLDPDPLRIDLTRLLADADPSSSRPRRNVSRRNDPPGAAPLDDALLASARPALAAGERVELVRAVQNTDRAVGARLAGEIAQRYGDAGLPAGSIHVHLEGSAGVSLGAFCVAGLTLEVWGEANDYVGKGMAGGEILLRPPRGSRVPSHQAFILGNAALYGATGGSLFAAGRAGERFAVRNSGACAVVEGVGDHGCEYMTGGTVLVLGAVGRNFAAGMTGGRAYVLDTAGTLRARLNPELVTAERITDEAEAAQVRAWVERHVERTGSEWGAHWLGHWPDALELLARVAPRS